MKKTDFSIIAPGQIAVIDDGGIAFVPNPLPPEIPIDWSLASVMSEADRALSELAGVARTLPNPHLLIRPFMRREAVLSSRIEGTQTSLSELFVFEGSDGSDDDEDHADVTEVRNYVLALEFGLLRIADLPICNRLIRETHATLMAGVRGENLSPGEFRRIQNWIGPPGTKIKDATYVPPPVPSMIDCMNQLETFLNAPSDLPPLVRMALIHYQFEAIHPFLDGNGRIGRLLITLMLCSERLMPQPLLYLSAFFERNRRDYYTHLLSVSQNGEWQSWIAFFLRGIAEQASDAIKRSRKLMDLWQEYRTRLQEGRASAVALQALDFLFTSPALTTKKLADSLDITVRAAQLNIDKLVDEKILTEITGKKRNRIYIASKIFAIVEAPTADGD